MAEDDMPSVPDTAKHMKAPDGSGQTVIYDTEVSGSSWIQGDLMDPNDLTNSIIG